MLPISSTGRLEGKVTVFTGAGSGNRSRRRDFKAIAALPVDAEDYPDGVRKEPKSPEL